MLPRLIIMVLAILIFLVVVFMVPDTPRVQDHVTSGNLITRSDYDVNGGWHYEGRTR